MDSLGLSEMLWMLGNVANAICKHSLQMGDKRVSSRIGLLGYHLKTTAISLIRKSCTDTYSGVSDVKFNKWLLWGSVTGTDTRAVYGGDQITEKEWHFELDIATEGEYKAVIPD
jgi:hypothetical protein